MENSVFFIAKNALFFKHMSHEAIYWTSHGLILSLVILTQYIVLPVLLQMVLYTAPIIYIGSHLSLEQKAIDPETGEKQLKTESMSKRDAWLFPIIGSGALLTLYIAYKFLPAYWVNLLIAIYLTFFGCVALGETFCSIIERGIPSIGKIPLLNVNWQCPSLIHKWLDSIEFEASVARATGHVLALLLAVGWAMTKHWTLHNVFAIAFCLQGIRMVSVGNFKIACTLLGGLFVYDVFWVFATDVMVTVAKSFEAPAKLIFPVSLVPWKQSILGLGDIVIPGVFIAMTLRFDLHLHEQAMHIPPEKSQSLSTDIHQHFNKVYFWCNIIAYELGLLVTGLVMLIFQHPQPALLYLVPFCLCGLFIPAFLLGDYGKVLVYTEEEEEEEDEKQKHESEQKDNETDLKESINNNEKKKDK